MFAVKLIALACIAQLGFAIEIDHLQLYCDIPEGKEPLTAELILSRKLQCNPPLLGSEKYICGISKDRLYATGHIKFTHHITEKTDAIIFRAKGNRSNLDSSNCYSCDSNKNGQPDKLCNGQYTALDFSLNQPVTCAGPGHKFEGDKDYYFHTFLPVDLFQHEDNVKYSLSGTEAASLVNCKVELELR